MGHPGTGHAAPEHRISRGHHLGTEPTPLVGQTPTKNHCLQHENTVGRGILSQPCPKGENDLGWIQLQQKWNHLRKVWGPTPDTLGKIQCKSLEEVDLCTPTRHLLRVIKRTWQIGRIHGLPSVSVSVFFPSSSNGDECWWGTRDTNTIYL
jgi:hypothetical protein